MIIVLSRIVFEDLLQCFLLPARYLELLQGHIDRVLAENARLPIEHAARRRASYHTVLTQ